MQKINSLLPVVLLLFCTTCNNNQEDIDKQSKVMKSNSSEMPPVMHDGERITKYTLTNSSGMRVSIINYGGAITEILAPDKDGNKGNVVLGFDSLSGYLQRNNPYFGALIGRYANRIAKGKFALDGKQYTLATNNIGNALHGGIKGFDKVMWKAKMLAGDSSLKLSYTSKDGEEGYPGNLFIKVIYTLSAANELKIDYTATTDKATPVNLTNHSYFNLSAGKDATILDHQLMISAVKFVEVNDSLIPTGKLPDVKSGPMDFNAEKPIGKDIQQVKGGYDHCWILKKSRPGFAKAASLWHKRSGRLMEVWTTEPGLQFYSGNFLDGSLTHTIDGASHIKHGGLCLEADHFPDSPNQPHFPGTILQPGSTYRQLTVYKFSTR